MPGAKPRIGVGSSGAAKIGSAVGLVGPLKTPFIVQHVHQNLKLVPGAHTAVIAAPCGGEDFSTWVLVDPDSALDVIDCQEWGVRLTGVSKRKPYLYKDFGANYFMTQDVRIRLAHEWAIHSGGTNGVAIGFNNDGSCDTTDAVYFDITWSNFSGGRISTVVNRYVGGALTQDSSLTTGLGSVPITFYIEIWLNVSEGKYILNVYDDSNYSNLVVSNEVAIGANHDFSHMRVVEYDDSLSEYGPRNIDYNATDFEIVEEGCAVVGIPIDFTTGWTLVDTGGLLNVVDADSVHAIKVAANTYPAVSHYRDYGAGFFNGRARIRFTLTASNGGLSGIFPFIAFSDSLTPATTPNNEVILFLQLYTLDAWVTQSINFTVQEYVGGVIVNTGGAFDITNVADPYTAYIEFEVNLNFDKIYCRAYSDPGFTTLIGSAESDLNEATWALRYLMVQSTYFTHDTFYQGRFDVDDFELAQC